MKMTYQAFVKIVDQTSNNFNWRYGQALMNVLYTVSKEKYNEICDSELDSYNDDSVIPKLLRLLEDDWNRIHDNHKEKNL